MDLNRYSLILATSVLTLAACGDDDAETPATPAASTEGTQAPEAPDEPTSETLALGSPAPMAERDMRGVDGAMHSIASVTKENGTLVVFTCNHCPYAIAWEERLVALAHTYIERGISTIAINSNDPEEYPIDGYEGMQARAEALSITFPYVVDEGSVVARAFGAEKTPEAFLFDARGRLVYHGAIDDSQDPDTVETRYLRDALEAVATQAEVPRAETPAVGCTIKYHDA